MSNNNNHSHHTHTHHVVYNGGFSTSLCDLFDNPYDRSSFCALTCCATFLQDRNEYILSHYQQQQNQNQQQQNQQTQQQQRPLDWWLRLLLYIGVSAILYVSVNRYINGINNAEKEGEEEQQEEQQDNYTYGGAEAVMLFLALLSVRATWKRAKFRQNVLRLVHSHHRQQVEQQQQQQQQQQHQEKDDYLYNEQEQVEQDYDDDDDDGLCSQNQRVHYTCSLVLADNDEHDCGCCRCCYCCCSDRQHTGSRHSADTGLTPHLSPQSHPSHPHPHHPRDVCSNLWTCLAASCCGGCLGCWWNCCGVCATAQEARELQRHVPVRSFYIDYITFEPWSNYYPTIQGLRRRHFESFWQHLQATSELSQMLLKILFVTLILLMMSSALHLVHNFSYQKVLVICATLAQAILVLYFCYWHDHRFDLSLDAIIKLFASGFCFATVFSMIVEQVLTLVGMNVLGLTLGILNANHAHDNDDNGDDSHNSAPAAANYNAFVDPRDYQDEPPEMFFLALIQQYPCVYIAYLFFSAFVVAGTVEEMAKYFCFWMVEHPDFVYDNQAAEPEQQQEQQAPPPPQQQAMSSASASSSSNGVATATATASQETQPLVASSTPSTTARQQYGTSTTTTSLSLPSSPPPPPQLVFEPGSFRSRAAAITVAMIATASGFACLENLIYVFGTGFGTSLKGEITILLFRSALPVHPLCAAIQSIGIVKRDIEHRYRNNRQQPQHENGHGLSLSLSSSSSLSYYGLGKAMLPAIILHGTFDFVLFVLGFLSALYAGNNGANGNGDGDENENEAMLKYSMAWSSSSPWTTGAPFNDSVGTTLNSYRVTGNNNKNDDDNATTTTLESASASSLLVWMNVLSLFAGPVIFLLGVVYYCVESFRQRSRLDAMDDDAAATLQQQQQQQGRRHHVPPVAVVTGLA